jgi:hypothetical protein
MTVLFPAHDDLAYNLMFQTLYLKIITTQRQAKRHVKRQTVSVLAKICAMITDEKGKQ